MSTLGVVFVIVFVQAVNIIIKKKLPRTCSEDIDDGIAKRWREQSLQTIMPQRL